MFSQNFLSEFIQENPYREHTQKNYTEKIFFFEPLNKFFDLLWIKKQAWR
jgi:hypothetical protein